LLLEGLPAGLEVDELKLQAERGGQGLEDAPARGDDFLADAIASDEAWEGQSELMLGG
jgi:hypothetical protein